MKRLFSIAAIVWLAAAGLAASPARAAGGKQVASKKGVKDEVIVVPAPGVSIDTINAEYGSTVVDTVNGTYLLKLPSGTATNQVVRELRADPNVWSASGNLFVAAPASKRGRHQTQTFPFDEATEKSPDRAKYDAAPFLSTLRIDQVETSQRGAGAVVAVIDTGVDLDHPDLANRIARTAGGDVLGLDLIDGGTPQDEPTSSGDNSAYGHGTFIAGLIAKVAPEARIMPIRALGPNGVGTAFDMVRAVDFAIANGANVINMSFGAPDKIDGLEEELRDARDHAVLVAAAGNDFSDKLKNYPADESFVLAVAAIDNQEVKADFSNWGSLVDLCAPGVEIRSTYPGGLFATWSGTSFATPLVAATAAIIVGKQRATGGFDPDCVSDLLVSTGRSLDGVPRNRQFRGKMGVLVDPAAGFQASGCGDDFDHVSLRAQVPGDRSSRGEAERSMNGSRQEFEVKLQGLAKNATHTLRITKTDATTFSVQFTTDKDGQITLKYESGSDDDDNPLPPQLDPVSGIDKIEVLNAAGTLLLSGSFSSGDDGDDGGGDDGGGGGGDDGGGGGGDGGGGGGDDGGGGGGGDDGGDDGGGDDGGGEADGHDEIDLDPVGADDDASGQAKWEIENGGASQKFRVKAEDLDASTAYELWVDGMLIGLIQTDDHGKFDIEYDNTPHGHDLPLPPSLDPVSGIMLVELRVDGAPILSGSF